MLRSFSRVVVVAAVALSLTLSLAPAAHARPQDAGRAAVEKADGGWFAAALTWLSRIVTGDAPKSGGMTSLHANVATGSCIDPWGRCP
jgi:hypothetical protein